MKNTSITLLIVSFWFFVSTSNFWLLELDAWPFCWDSLLKSVFNGLVGSLCLGNCKFNKIWRKKWKRLINLNKNREVFVMGHTSLQKSFIKTIISCSLNWPLMSFSCSIAFRISSLEIFLHCSGGCDCSVFAHNVLKLQMSSFNFC